MDELAFAIPYAPILCKQWAFHVHMFNEKNWILVSQKIKRDTSQKDFTIHHGVSCDIFVR